MQEMANIRVVKAWQQEIENDVSELYELKGKEEGDTELLDDAGDSVFSRYKSVKTELRKRIDNPPVSMKKVYRTLRKRLICTVSTRKVLRLILNSSKKPMTFPKMKV